MSNEKLRLSTLSKTWILDLDGTLVKHNGYKIDGYDTLLSGVKEFIDSLGEDDLIIILTARKEEFKKNTEEFLNNNEIRFDKIIYDVPMGERILVNDKKPSGLKMAYAINSDRDKALDIGFVIDEDL